MSKIAKIFMGLLIFVLFSALFASKTASASYRERVLAAETSIPQIPPTTDGPGLILPDSPLFFLDNLKQNVRLFLAFTPEQKAQVYTSIAGERLAELRFMLAKGNQEGTRTALQGVSDNLSKSADSLGMAKLSGRNVSKLAERINKNIKEKQQTLDLLETQAGGELAAQVNASSQTLLEAKIRVEDALPSDQLDNEIRDGLARQAARRVAQASDSAKQLEEDLNELNSQASEAAKKSLKVREEALQRAIASKNEALKRVEQNLLNVEKQKQENLLKVQGQAADQAREAIEKAKAAALNFQKAQQKVNEIRNQTPQITSQVATGSSVKSAETSLSSDF